MEHTLERSYSKPNFADSLFPLIKPDDWEGGKSWRKMSVHKSSTFTSAVYIHPRPLRSCLISAFPRSATNPDASVTISYCVHVSAREDFLDFKNEPGGGGNGLGEKILCQQISFSLMTLPVKRFYYARHPHLVHRT